MMSKRLFDPLRKLWYLYLIHKDKKRGVDFYLPVEKGEMRETQEGNVHYAATSPLYYRSLKEFLRRQDNGGNRIMDIGCGKGRMLEFFHNFGFSKADGLEYSSELAEIARKNMKTLGLPCEVFTGDAAEFEEYDTYDWFYLFNPFHQNIMLRFIGNLKESLRRNPRAITIVYTNPICASDFARAGFHLEYVGEGRHQFCVVTSEGGAGKRGGV